MLLFFIMRWTDYIFLSPCKGIAIYVVRIIYKWLGLVSFGQSKFGALGCGIVIGNARLPPACDVFSITQALPQLFPKSSKVQY